MKRHECQFCAMLRGFFALRSAVSTATRARGESAQTKESLRLMRCLLSILRPHPFPEIQFCVGNTGRSPEARAVSPAPAEFVDKH